MQNILEQSNLGKEFGKFSKQAKLFFEIREQLKALPEIIENDDPNIQPILSHILLEYKSRENELFEMQEQEKIRELYRIDTFEEDNEILKKISQIIEEKGLQQQILELISNVKENNEIKQVIHQGEGPTIEFKSSLRWDMRRNCVNKDLEYVVIKEISGFLNSNGGILLIV